MTPVLSPSGLLRAFWRATEMPSSDAEDKGGNLFFLLSSLGGGDFIFPFSILFSIFFLLSKYIFVLGSVFVLSV